MGCQNFGEQLNLMCQNVGPHVFAIKIILSLNSTFHESFEVPSYCIIIPPYSSKTLSSLLTSTMTLFPNKCTFYTFQGLGGYSFNIFIFMGHSSTCSIGLPAALSVHQADFHLRSSLHGSPSVQKPKKHNYSLLTIKMSLPMLLAR